MCKHKHVSVRTYEFYILKRALPRWLTVGTSRDVPPGISIGNSEEKIILYSAPIAPPPLLATRRLSRNSDTNFITRPERSGIRSDARQRSLGRRNLLPAPPHRLSALTIRLTRGLLLIWTCRVRNGSRSGSNWHGPKSRELRCRRNRGQSRGEQKKSSLCFTL